MDWGPNSPLWAVFFWVNAIVCLALAIVVIRVIRKYEARRKQLERDIKTPGLHNLRWLFKHKLKEHSIEEAKLIIKPPDASSN
ncbi:MAG: hypothetical protein BWY44_00011 [Candidatus Omnitrophica bacterium ADurb.Bin292]|nr:MAG: hypothetical protein BWY44_00011 [Candidatus Omnitrophica bacterium ADurb.Bin292]